MNDLNLLNSNFQRAVFPLLAELKNKGINYQVTSTKRTQAEQDQLTKDGYPTSDNSNHLTGKAVDIWIENPEQRNKASLVAQAKGFRVIKYGVVKGRDLNPLLHIDFRKEKKNNLSLYILAGVVLGGLVLYGFFKNNQKPISEWPERLG